MEFKPYEAVYTEEIIESLGVLRVGLEETSEIKGDASSLLM